MYLPSEGREDIVAKVCESGSKTLASVREDKAEVVKGGTESEEGARWRTGRRWASQHAEKLRSIWN
ncbi:predicted protein [Histoplasma mississippiense (nom. inval.)]|uniref:predicted protein n=1 Tax=Ajellomyces capsulatus (strain NAm1 / WU24) TaxID=2059318 RepID=UPI000157C44B|nr:predicted protein [Histoplasma mississippiense (nom. inval.)]EDN08475.1 predicted protein [Histoplasma mississippiense (nom. inval.)]